jgi:hypothetical protein
MRATGLNGRLTRLERALAPPPAHQCRSCGLRHVRPLTMDLVRRIIGLTPWASIALQRAVTANPLPPLCLCAPCCGDPGDHSFARLSHGLPPDGDAA